VAYIAIGLLWFFFLFASDLKAAEPTKQIKSAVSEIKKKRDTPYARQKIVPSITAAIMVMKMMTLKTWTKLTSTNLLSQKEEVNSLLYLLLLHVPLLHPLLVYTNAVALLTKRLKLKSSL
jgi:hypothetical protein